MTEKQLVNKYAKAMYSKMAERKAKYEAFGWRKKTKEELFDWLLEEVEELREAYDPIEALDVGILAMFIWDVINNKKT